jgi:hypothetical protein
MMADRDFLYRILRFALFVTTALVILLSPILCLAGTKVGKVIALQGRVEIKRETETGFHRARLSDEVEERDVIRTGARSRVKILYQDESLLFLAEDSEVQVKEFRYEPLQKYRRALLKAFGGKVRFLVSKLMSAGKSRFEVETSTAVMGVRGTDGIAVMKSPTQAVCLSGEIYVHGLGMVREVILTPYMMTIIEAGRDPTQPFPVDRGYIRQLLQDFRIRLLSEGEEGELIPPAPPSGGPVRFGAGGPSDMTETVGAWGGQAASGSADMTDTIQSWGPSWKIGPGEEIPRVPPVLLESPAGQRRLSPSHPSPPKREQPGPETPPGKE